MRKLDETITKLQQVDLEWNRLQDYIENETGRMYEQASILPRDSEQRRVLWQEIDTLIRTTILRQLEILSTVAISAENVGIFSAADTETLTNVANMAQTLKTYIENDCPGEININIQTRALAIMVPLGKTKTRFKEILDSIQL